MRRIILVGTISMVLLAGAVCATAERKATARMAAWHETMVRFNETVPTTTVLTYDTDIVNSFFVSKMITEVNGTPSTEVEELVVEDFPGGVEADYVLDGADVKALFVPLMAGRETPEKDGAALYRIRTEKGTKLAVECGPGARAQNFAVAELNDWTLMRALDFNYSTNSVEITVDGGFAVLKDASLPFVTVIRSNGKISKGRDSEKGSYVRIESKRGRLDVVVAYAPDAAAAKKLIPADNDKALAAVEAYYDDLLSSSIETPEKKLDAAFLSAIYNLEYNYVAPYGWVECIGYWHAIWHQQHSAAAEWLGQSDRSRQCLIEQLERIFPDGQVPNIHMDGRGFMAFGGTNQYLMWEVRHYLRFTRDVEFARWVAPYLDKVLKGTIARADADGNWLFGWGLQIGNQEDFVATPHDGTSPTIEAINMMLTRAEVADLLGDAETAALWRGRAAISKSRLKDALWMSDLGRFGFFVDPQGVLRPDGQYHSNLYPALWDIVDPIDQYTSVRHVHDRLFDEETGEVYCSNNFPEHYAGTWGMQAGCAQQPWGAWTFAKTGLRNEAWRPLAAAAEWVMCDDLRGSWPEVDDSFTPSYFSPPAGLYIASAIESLFGLHPNQLDKSFTISPSFPDHWPEAKLKLPNHTAVYSREGNSVRYEVSGTGDCRREIRWKLPACSIESFKLDGKAADYRIEPGVGYVELIADAPASDQTVIEFSFTAVDADFDYPKSIAEGDEFCVTSEGVTIDKVIDRAGVLANITSQTSRLTSKISTGLLDKYTAFGPLGALNFSRRSVFLECSAPNGVQFIQPIDFSVLPRYEARLNGNELLVRNNTQQALSGEAVFAETPFMIEVGARSEKRFAVTLPKLLSPGENVAQLLLPTGAVLEVPFVAEVHTRPDFVSAVLDASELMLDSQWNSLRVFQGQPHVFVAWPGWMEPLKSLEGKNELAVEEIPGLKFNINDRRFVPVARKVDKPVYRQMLEPGKYKKFYLLVLPLVDNHDIFTEVARVTAYNGENRVGGKTLRYPGDLDYINPVQAPVGGSYRGSRSERYPILPQLGADEGDWTEGMAPGFMQPEYWSRSLPVPLESGILTLVEVDLGEARDADAIVFEALGEYPAFGLLGIVGEKYSDPSVRTAVGLDGWTLEGNAFSVAPVPGLFDEPTLNSLAKAGESATGKAVSPVFKILEDDMSLYLGCQGGNSQMGSLNVRVVDAESGELLVANSGTFPAEAGPPGSHVPTRYEVPLVEFQGRSVRIELIDNDTRDAYAWIGLKSVKIKSIEN